MINMAEESETAVDVAKLPLPQLTQLKQQLDTEIDLYGTSLQQLKLAQTKFQESSECVQKLNCCTAKKAMLIPLSDSMYVPGVVHDVETVIVDVGTGYYIDMTIPAATDYFKRKVVFVTTQIEKIQQAAKEKLVMRGIVIDAIENKLQAAVGSLPAQSTAKS